MRGDANANDKFREQNIRLDTALNNMSQGLCMFNADEEIVVFNRRFLEMYKLSPQVVKPGCTLRELIQHRKEVGLLDADPETYYRGIIDDIRQGKTTTELVKTTDRPAGPGVQPADARGGWVTTHEDVTERRRAEDQVREQKLQMDAALDNISQGLLMFGADGGLILCNCRYLELYDLGPADVHPGGLTLAGSACSCARQPARSCAIRRSTSAELKAALAAQASPSRSRRELADGRIICIENHPMAGGGWVSTHEDITERMRAEQQLREQKHPARHRPEQHVARPQHVRRDGPSCGLQRALSADVWPLAG